MLDPFRALAELGDSPRFGSAAAGMKTEIPCSPDLILRLDWMRLAELVRAISAHAGCELARSIVLEDGSVMFGMIERPNTPHPQRALVKTAPWNEWGATPETVMRFAREVRTAARTRGILVAPAGFTPAAQLAAQQHRIEMVDATALHRVLETLAEERRGLLLAIATAGDYLTPTCPVCLEKLSRQEGATQEELGHRVRRIQESGLVADPVEADCVEVAQGAEVTFLHEVRSRELRIAGGAVGDFVCEGPVTLLPGGMLDGTLAARSVRVEDGAELRGRFRILQGPPMPFVKEVRPWRWRCPGVSGKPECRRVNFEPHHG
ncbi:MAG: polymer-forming cytoskeletal protein [Prosthecobacter sp.]|jgi:hypothetical protein|nr:polymer-forming cytoskeletal protein [Prosthecobacter sp.]